MKAFVHALNRMLPRPTHEEHQLHLLVEKLNKLEKKRPNSYTGRNLYFKELMGLAKEWIEEGKGKWGPVYQYSIMSHHGEVWKDKTDYQKAQYERRAAPYRDAAALKLAQMTAELRDQVTTLQAELDSKVTNDVPLTMSAAQLNEQDEELFEILLTDPQYSGKHLDKLRSDAAKAPPVISPELQKLLKEQVLFDPDDFFALHKPEWLASVCELSRM